MKFHYLNGFPVNTTRTLVIMFIIMRQENKYRLSAMYIG